MKIIKQVKTGLKLQEEELQKVLGGRTVRKDNSNSAWICNCTGTDNNNKGIYCKCTD